MVCSFCSLFHIKIQLRYSYLFSLESRFFRKKLTLFGICSLFLTIFGIHSCGPKERKEYMQQVVSWKDDYGYLSTCFAICCRSTTMFVIDETEVIILDVSLKWE
ncbi:hypothetical protein KTGMC3_P0996 [Methanocalculus sp. MC3]